MALGTLSYIALEVAVAGGRGFRRWCGD